jgi:hypothetical protein
MAENLPRIWTDDEVNSLNAYQVAGVMHPFTCGHYKCSPPHSIELVAYPEGWRCPITGEMVQNWAHDFMLNWEWAKHDWLGRTWNKEKGNWE